MAETRIKNIIEMEPVNIPKTTEAALMSTVTLSKYVNTLFNGVFKDYTGCKVYPVLNDIYSARHQVRCDLYFTLGSDNLMGAKIAAFKPIANGVKSTIGAKANYTEVIMQHNARLRSLNSAVITQDAIDIIHPLLWFELAAQTKETAEAYSKKGIIKEQSTPLPYNDRSQMVTPVISFADIDSIISTIEHGCTLDKKTGRRFDDHYITPVRSISSIANQQYMYQQAQTGVENYLYQISKIDKAQLNDLANEIGMISRTGSADCFTDVWK